MKNRLVNQISPWNVKEQNIISILNEPQDYSNLKYFSNQTLSQFKQKNKISNHPQTINKKFGMPSVYKEFDSKYNSQQKRMKKSMMKVQIFSKTQTFDIKFKGINHSESKKSKQSQTKLLTRRYFGKVIKSNNPQKTSIDKQKQFEKNYSNLKIKLQWLMKNHKSQEQIFIKKQKQKIENINSKLMYQSVKTIDPFICFTDRLGKQKKDLKNFNSHYLDKLIGRYQ